MEKYSGRVNQNLFIHTFKVLWLMILELQDTQLFVKNFRINGGFYLLYKVNCYKPKYFKNIYK